MKSEYLGRIPLAEAINREARIFTDIRSGTGHGVVLGFEPEPVVTMGTRAEEKDLRLSREDLCDRGFPVQAVPRGGQVTLHNPGQLIIFPVVRHGPLGAKGWVEFVARVTADWLRMLNCPVSWDGCRPGLYSKTGKVVAMGFRLRQGISTHGISINIHNDLAPFKWIRPCGQECASVDRLRTEMSLAEVFNSWFINFKGELTSVRNSQNLMGLTVSCARSSVG